MQEQFEELTKEGKEFVQLKKAYDTQRMPDAGTATYIIEVQWLVKYRKYAFYDALKYNQEPSPSEDHFTANHPGAITN